MTPADVERLFQSKAPNSFTGSHNGEGPTISVEEHDRRVTALKEVLVVARQQWLAQAEGLDHLAEKLGDGSRDPTWRVPIGESGLLAFFSSIAPTAGLRQALRIHSLRLIGNSCADTDENRSIVVSGGFLPPIIGLLSDDSILAFIIPVLYNICVDYDPAQLDACKAGLGHALVNLVSTPRLMHCQAFLNIIGKLFGLLVSQEPEATLADPATPIYLLGLATSRTSPVDAEDFCVLVSAALTYLTYERFQEELISRGAVPALLAAFSNSYTELDPSQLDSDDAAQLKQIRTAFVQVISDVSALPAFASAHPLGNNSVVQTLQGWLQSGRGHTNLETAACLALGNLCRSDDSSIRFVQDLGGHLGLISLLSSPYRASSLGPESTHPNNNNNAVAVTATTTTPPSQLLHAVLSSLKNLAIPPRNKHTLGALLLDPPASCILARLWAATDAQPQTQFAAVSLTRLLVVSTPDNVRRLCGPLSADPASPARERSNLHVLTSLFLRSDAEPTKMEAARAVAAVCRVLNTPAATTTDATPILDDAWASSGSGDFSSGITTNTTTAAAAALPDDYRRSRFYETHHDIARALAYLVTQSRFPALRSEAWFVFALMSRAEDGARVVIRALQSVEAARALVEAVSGRDLVDGQLLDPHGEGEDADGEMEAAGAVAMAVEGKGGGEESAGAAGSGNGENSQIERLGLQPQQADPKQKASMARIDRENGLVLLSQLMSNYEDCVQPFRRSVYRELLRTGGNLVLNDRARDLGEKEDAELVATRAQQELDRIRPF